MDTATAFAIGFLVGSLGFLLLLIVLCKIWKPHTAESVTREIIRHNQTAWQWKHTVAETPKEPEKGS